MAGRLSNTTSTASAPLLAGRYELLRTQETDASTAAILGWDQRLKRWRSIRVARPGDVEAGDRLIALAQRAAKLEHPNLERVIDVGRDGAIAFVVRDRFVCSVAQHLARHGPVPAGWAARAVARCAEGLAWAHPRGIVHGHPRPDVVLFAEDGEAVLTHFGQRATLRDDEETRLGAPWAHLAPELRQYWEPSPATDVFGLGALLFTMLSGHHSAELFYAEAYEGMLAQVPRALRPVVLRACAFEPRERYATAAELQQALESKLHALPEVQEPPPWLEATQEFPDRGALTDPDALIVELATELGSGESVQGDRSEVSASSQAVTVDPTPVAQIPYSMPAPAPPPLGSISTEPEDLYVYSTGVPPVPRADAPLVIGTAATGVRLPKPEVGPSPEERARTLQRVVVAFVAGIALLCVAIGVGFALVNYDPYQDNKFIAVVEAEWPTVSRWAGDDAELTELWQRYRAAPPDVRANAASALVEAAEEHVDRAPDNVRNTVQRAVQRMSGARQYWQSTQ